MTSFTELVGCELPLQQAGMGGPGRALPLAVDGTGALATISWQVAPPYEELPDSIAVNFLMPFVNREAVAAAAERARVVEFFYGDPDAELVEIVHSGDALASWQVGSVAEARAAEDAGCDYITVQGVEAGGHVRGTTPVRELLAAVLRDARVPVVAAGGIATARGVAELLGLGAAGVRVGTRFLTAEESDVHPLYVEALLEAGGDDTELTEVFGANWPDAPHRVLRSAIAAAQAFEGNVVARRGDFEIGRFMTTPPTRETEGAIEAMALYAGTGVGEVRQVEPAADIVRDLCSLL